MAGRPRKNEKKIREAIYFEPHLLEWLQAKAEAEKCTVSVIVNRITEATREQEG